MVAKVGALVADLSATSASFAADMGKARKALGSSTAKMNRSLGALNKGFGKMRGAIRGFGGLLAGLSVAAVGAFVKKTLNAADAIGKASTAAGVSTDFLQSYALAARLAGGTTEGWQGAVVKAAKVIGELRVGTGSLFAILKKSNPALLAQLQATTDTETAIKLILTSMGDLTNETDRLALSSAVFGRTFGDTAAIMTTDGVASLEATAQKARDLGLVLSEDLIRNAEKTNDMMTILADVISVQFQSAVLEAAPLIQDMVVAFAELVVFVRESAEAFKKGIAIIKRGLGTLQRGADLIGQIASFGFGKVRGAIGGAVSALPGFRSGGEFTVRGSGGFDSQVAAFRVSPGERVSVGDVGGGAGGSVTIDARGAELGVERRIRRVLDEMGGAMLTPGRLDDARRRSGAAGEVFA